MAIIIKEGIIMKKILAIFLILTATNTPAFASYVDKQLKEMKKTPRYNTVQTHKKNYETQLSMPQKTQINSQIKDPKLIKLSNVKPVEQKLYDEKIKKDEEIYNTKIKKAILKKTNSVNVNPDSVDFYNVYRISERLIRANNLDYVNWRIAIRKSEDFNAASFEGNYIKINTALYDTLYENNDALAFVIAHEMAHHILGHSQRKIERKKTNQKIYASSLCLLYAYPIPLLIKGKMDINEDRLMEHMADAEAFKLIIQAGFSANNAMEALNFMEGLPNVKDFWADHPIPAERIANVKETVMYANPDWVEIGKLNIYNSSVLNCKKSSDRVSIVINSAKNPDGFYQPETAEQFMTRMAYISYKTGNMHAAIKYFSKLAKIKGDYVSYLYLSYAAEYLFNTVKNPKYLKLSLKAIEKAKSLAPQDKNVSDQYDEVTKRYSEL